MWLAWTKDQNSLYSPSGEPASLGGRHVGRAGSGRASLGPFLRPLFTMHNPLTFATLGCVWEGGVARKRATSYPPCTLPTLGALRSAHGGGSSAEGRPVAGPEIRQEDPV